MSPDVDTAAAPPVVQQSAAAWANIVTRLFAIVFIAIMPALALQTYNQVDLRQTREAEVRADALRLAKFASGEVDRIMENGRSVLLALSNLPAVRNHDTAACSEYAAGLGKSFPQYLAIGAIDTQGRVFCANREFPPVADVRDRWYFRQALDAGGFVIGDYTLGRLVKKPVLPLILSFTGADGKIAGAVYVSLDVAWLAHYFLEDRPLGKQATLAIGDRNGTILARIPDNTEYAGTKFAAVYNAQVFAKEPGTAEVDGVDGVRRVVGYVPVDSPPVGLYVGVGLTKADAFAAVDAASRAGFLLIIFSLAVGLLVAWLGGRHFISRPIEKLVLASAQWGQANFAARADLGRGRSELSQLGRTFDGMAQELLRQQEANSALLATLEARVQERTRFLEEAQSDLKDANAALATRAGELAVANEELRAEMGHRERAEDALRHLQKLEALGQLTGGVAHDFNNLLQVILGALDGAHRRLSRGGSITAADGWEQIRPAIRSAERAAVLTRQLLAFARRQPLAPQVLDVNRLVAGMSELLRRTLGEAVEIETVLAGGIWSVFADGGQLENAIINLAVNARDAMRDGGKLTIETANAFLDDAYANTHDEVRSGQYVLLAVSDDGAGMTRQVLAQAFDPFFTTKDVGHGTGLGLSQVYGFIKQSGGHIKAYSEPGQGTTVRMYLPRTLSADTVASTAAPEEPPAGHSDLILVVEDEDDVRAATAGMLRELGYTVIEAIDAATALRLLSENAAVRLLFTDVGLPGGQNGRHLADAAVKMRPDLQVLYTTGYARNAIVHQGMLDPGVELIVKPFTYAALAAKIRSLL